MPSLLTQPELFSKALADWFAAHAKEYPWRQTRDPYAILVSEIMLQQTQIPTVLERGYYTRWMERFPDLKTLAAAREEDVLKAWEGLGYYRRARNLQRLAQVVAATLEGKLPRAAAALRELPGIGPYTAGAVASFAFDEPAPVVDGNIARVLSRLTDDATPVDSPAGQKRLWATATTLVTTAASPRAHNAALMELGQTHCRPGVPLCADCPVRSFCAAPAPATLPVKQRRVEITQTTERVFYLASDQGLLLEQETGSRRTGLWKLPALPDRSPLPPVLYKGTYAITRYRVTLWVHEAPPGGIYSGAVMPWADLSALALASPYRRAVEAVRKAGMFALK